MPYISISTSVKMTDAQKEEMKVQLGKNISVIEGKQESGLIICFIDGVDMFFRGEKNDAGAFVDVRLYQQSKYEEKEQFAKTVYKSFEEILSLDEASVTINMIELFEWGSRGNYSKA